MIFSKFIYVQLISFTNAIRSQQNLALIINNLKRWHSDQLQCHFEQTC